MQYPAGYIANVSKTDMALRPGAGQPGRLPRPHLPLVRRRARLPLRLRPALHHLRLRRQQPDAPRHELRHRRANEQLLRRCLHRPVPLRLTGRHPHQHRRRRLRLRRATLRWRARPRAAPAQDARGVRARAQCHRQRERHVGADARELGASGGEWGTRAVSGELSSCAGWRAGGAGERRVCDYGG